VTEHGEIFFAGRLGHAAFPELPAQPVAAVFEKTRRGVRIVKGLVVTRAILLVVGVLAEGTTEGRGMRTREHGEGGEALRMAVGDAPRDLDARVGPHEMKGPGRVSVHCREVEHVGHEPVDAVGGEAGRRSGTHARGIAALIGGDRVIAGRGESGHLLPPRVPRLGIAVKQEHEGSLRRSRHLGGELPFGSADDVDKLRGGP
jgi:hypothetical protein